MLYQVVKLGAVYLTVSPNCYYGCLKSIAVLLANGSDERWGNEEIFRRRIRLEYGPMPNLMVALPNIGGALCSTPQSLA